MNVAGATTTTLATDETDIGKFVRCLVVATNANGPSNATPSASSAALEELQIAAIPDLAIWLDASVASTIRTTGGAQAADGQDVLEWQDLSGNDTHAAYGSGAEPTYAATFGLLGGVLFSNGVLNFSGALPFAADGGSLFVVCKGTVDPENLSSYYGAAYCFSANAQGNHQPYQGNYYDNFARDSRVEWAMAYQSNVHLYEAVSGTSWKAWKNGALLVTAEGNTPTDSFNNMIGAAGRQEPVHVPVAVTAAGEPAYCAEMVGGVRFSGFVPLDPRRE